MEEDLATLERSIREIQIEWEKFFSGLEKRPPAALKTRLENLIRAHANAEIRNNAHRFRYQSLTARYTTFAELWAKRLRALEEGRPLNPRAPRLRAPTSAVPLEDTGAPPAAEFADDEASPLEELLGLPPPPPPRPKPRPAGGEYRVTDPTHDLRLVRSLFEDFVEERRKTGEPAAVKFDSFQKLISQQAARILKDKGASAVDFRLETKDGKVSLKAKAVK